MLDKKLYAECMSLSYTTANTVTDEIISDTCASLKHLFSTYGYPRVLGTLFKIWPLPKAIRFFERFALTPVVPQQVKVIATCYTKFYNGGVERVLAQLMEIWSAMGYRIILFTQEPPNHADYPYPNTVKRVLLPPPPPSSALTKRLDILQKTFLEEKVDVFINHQWINPTLLWECMLTKMLHIPYLLYVHGNFAASYQFGLDYALQTSRVFRLCDLVLSLSSTNARFYQLAGCRSVEVQNPIPNNLFHAILSDVQKHPHHILSVGRIAPGKRPLDMIRILASVKKKIPDAILDIYGSDEASLEKPMRALARSLGVENAVVFHGFKTSEELMKIYPRYPLLLFTSEMEGYPMVLLEAKAHGLPIIMYDLPYLTEVKDQKGILNAPVGNTQALAEHIITLFSNQELLQIYAEQSRDSFQHLCSHDPQNMWENIFQSLTGNLSSDDGDNFYDPADVSPADQFLLPTLLNEIARGLEKDRERIIGRKVYRWLRPWRQLWKKLKDGVWKK